MIVIKDVFWDSLCNICILIMQHLSELTGWSYGFINVLLFVVLGPLSTLLFMGSSLVFAVKTENERIRKIIGWSLFGTGALIVLFVLCLIAYATLTIPIDFY